MCNLCTGAVQDPFSTAHGGRRGVQVAGPECGQAGHREGEDVRRVRGATPGRGRDQCLHSVRTTLALLFLRHERPQGVCLSVIRPFHDIGQTFSRRKLHL